MRSLFGLLFVFVVWFLKLHDDDMIIIIMIMMHYNLFRIPSRISHYK